MDVKEEMSAIKAKNSPSVLEIKKYVRYVINVQKYGSEEVFEDVPHWNSEKVDMAIKEVERENLKPRPKRYYVSLKEPLEDTALR